MKTYLYIILILTPLFFNNSSFASYPLQDFEMIITESLSEDLNLSMSLSDITKAKQRSRIGETKKSLYQILTKRLSPLLSGQAMSSEYNLMALATELPIDAIIADLMTLESKTNGSSQPADFLVVIIPKTPASLQYDQLFPFAPLYSQTKASVIDNHTTGFLPQKSYSELINERVSNALYLTYKRNFMDSDANEAFFAGALLDVHMDGANSFIRLQMMGGLPTLPDQAFVQESPEANFELIRFPKAPTYSNLNNNNFPGTIIDLTYSPQQEKPLTLTIKFGSLATVEDKSFQIADEPVDIADQTFGMIASFFHDYNVPNLYGKPNKPKGPVIDDYLKLAHNIQLNIHEVEIDLNKLEITKMRTTIDLPSKSNWWFSLPTIEMEAISETVTEKGNEALEPYREKVQSTLDMGVDGFLQNPEARSEFLKVLLTLMENKNSGGQP